MAELGDRGYARLIRWHARDPSGHVRGVPRQRPSQCRRWRPSWTKRPAQFYGTIHRCVRAHILPQRRLEAALARQSHRDFSPKSCFCTLVSCVPGLAGPVTLRCRPDPAAEKSLQSAPGTGTWRPACIRRRRPTAPTRWAWSRRSILLNRGRRGVRRASPAHRGGGENCSAQRKRGSVGQPLPHEARRR